MSHQKVSRFGHPDFATVRQEDDFIWVNEFNEESLLQFYRAFTEKELDDSNRVIVVVISSYGGEVSSLMAMRDLIKSSPKPVATLALGKAMSAGACLLAAGTKGLRFASPDTLLMIHEVSGGAMGKTADVVESAQVMGELNLKLLNNLAADCGLSMEDIENQLRSKKNVDWTLTAQAAKKLGLIDHVAIPRHITRMPEKELSNPPTWTEMESVELKRLGLTKKKKTRK